MGAAPWSLGRDCVAASEPSTPAASPPPAMAHINAAEDEARATQAAVALTRRLAAGYLPMSLYCFCAGLLHIGLALRGDALQGAQRRLMASNFWCHVALVASVLSAQAAMNR